MDTMYLSNYVSGETVCIKPDGGGCAGETLRTSCRRRPKLALHYNYDGGAFIVLTDSERALIRQELGELPLCHCEQ